jgi:hypothetical protein
MLVINYGHSRIGGQHVDAMRSNRPGIVPWSISGSRTNEGSLAQKDGGLLRGRRDGNYLLLGNRL